MFDNHHDVFFANIGDVALTGLYVKLENAQNIKLDEYWTIREGSANTSLAAFASSQWLGSAFVAPLTKRAAPLCCVRNVTQ